jgi:hypothetical protein
MGDGNVQLSMTNLTQMDRHQTDSHRAPVVNQAQNAEIVREQAEQKVRSPAPPDKSEGKTIDPNARREEEQRKRKKKKDAEKGEHGVPLPRPRSGSGRFVDFEA